jgi:hypothetical protein
MRTLVFLLGFSKPFSLGLGQDTVALDSSCFADDKATIEQWNLAFQQIKQFSGAAKLGLTSLIADPNGDSDLVTTTKELWQWIFNDMSPRGMNKVLGMLILWFLRLSLPFVQISKHMSSGVKRCHYSHKQSIAHQRFAQRPNPAILR